MDQKLLDGLLDTMVPMDNATPYFRGLLYGESGVGKTLQATGVGKNVLYLESDPEGWVTLMSYPDHLNRCTRSEFKGISHLDAIAQAITEGVEPFDKYDTLVIDTLSHIAVHDLDTVLKSRSQKDPNKDPDVPSQPDYGASTERVRRSVTRILKLPIHVVMTAHAREDRDQVTGRVTIRPSFTPKLRKDVERMCHLIGYMTAIQSGDSYVHKMQVHPTTNVAAKSRIGGLPIVMDIDDPDAVGNLVNDWLASGGVEEIEESIKPDTKGVVPPGTVSETDESTVEDELEI